MTNSDEKQAGPANGAKQEAQENVQKPPSMPPKNELFYVSETKKIREARIAADRKNRNRNG